MHGVTREAPLTRWQRIAGTVHIPNAEELCWAFRGELGRGVDKVGRILWNGQVYEAPSSHRRPTAYRVRIRFDLLDHSQIWIEDDDGTLHACPLYRVRSHTERRRRHPRPPTGLSFGDLFNDDESP